MAAHQAPPSWDSPGMNTGAGCHVLLQCMKVKSEREVAQSCPTLRPHGLQPTRLLCPWDFPGKSTGVGCHCLLRLPMNKSGIWVYLLYSEGEGNGNPLLYSCLKKPVDRGAWQATVHGVAKSLTWFSTHKHTIFRISCITPEAILPLFLTII